MFLHTKELIDLKDIKTKQKVQMIKTKDSKANIKHFIKQQSIRTHNTDKDTRQESISSGANVQATNSVKRTAKQTFIESSYRTTKFIKEKRNEHKINKQNPLPNHNEIHPQKASYIPKAKQTIVNKVNASKIKQTGEKIVSTPVVQNTTKAFKTTYNVIKKSVSSVGALFSFGTGLILLLVLVLFIGTFGVLAQDGGSNSEIVSLSEEVIAFEDTIRKYAEEQGIEDYVAILEAIMMQESKGLGNDPMQCSESGFNTEYPRVPNGITDPEYSIECGVKTFADCLLQTGITDKSDTEKLYLAIQGYNYGNGYITWALNNFGGYSKYNAQLFSDNMKAQLNTDVYGDPNYVDYVMQYVPVTFRGGTDPNFNNMEAWITKNPYAPTYYGQCTWFAWGRFYELYGYDPGFTGNGWNCVDQLVAAHPDLFERSLSPKPGSVFSGIGVNHVGIVIAVDGDYVTIQEGNLDGKTNTFQDAKTDWHTVTYTLNQLRSYYRGVVFANQITTKK